MPACSGAPLPVKRASQLLKSTSSWCGGGKRAGRGLALPGPQEYHRSSKPWQPPGRAAPQSLPCRWMGALRCSASFGACWVLGRGHIYPEVDDRHSGAVGPAYNAVEVLQAGGEEGAEGASQPNLPGLLEALEVSTPDAAHATTQWGIQGHQVKLPRETTELDVHGFSHHHHLPSAGTWHSQQAGSPGARGRPRGPDLAGGGCSSC